MRDIALSSSIVVLLGALMIGMLMLTGSRGAGDRALPAGSAAVLITLAASASYIAVPPAMRMALPDANPSIALTLSFGVTFPFNLTIGIPLISH